MSRLENKNINKKYSNKKRFIWTALLLIAILTTLAWILRTNPMLEQSTRPNNIWPSDDLTDNNEPPLIAPFYPTFKNIWQIASIEDLLRYLYAADETAYVTEDDLDINQFMSIDLSEDLTGSQPKILIYHTHSQETFADSGEGVQEDSIVGIGQVLAEILSRQYKVSVVHDRGFYDVADGKEKRDGSYERMEKGIKKVLEKYPSIDVTIDLHRDGVPEGVHLVTDINGEPTARLMMFNGITRLKRRGAPQEMPDLPNPYLKENFALSLQMQLTGNEFYPGLMRRIYIKAYRYGLHMTPKAMLIEVGANTNTVREAQNAMAPLAEILMSVLQQKD